MCLDMGRGSSFHKMLRTALLFVPLWAGLNCALETAAVAQDHRATARSRPVGSAAGDARPIDSDRDDADRASSGTNDSRAGEQDGTSYEHGRLRHTQDCIESSRNEPRWQDKTTLTEPHCAGR
jgi:hypothetical protein